MSGNNLAAALIKARANFTQAVKDKVNPHLKSKYADLGSVTEACEKALAAEGLVVIQTTDFDAERTWIETNIVHAPTGELVKSRLPFFLQNDPQKTGSALTYVRRYSLALTAGVIVDDDDGAAVAKPAPAAAKPAGGGAKALEAATAAPAPAVSDDVAAMWVKNLTEAADLQALNGYAKGLAKLALNPEQRAKCEAAYTESNKRLRANQGAA